MNKLFSVIIITIASNAISEPKVLDHLYEISEPNSRIAERVALVNATARNLELAAASSSLQELIDDISIMEGLSHIDQGKLLGNMAIISIASGDYESGLLSIKKSIDLMEMSIKPFDPIYIQALIVKGIGALAVDDFSNSKEAFRRAQHILHREHGVFTLSQLPLIDYLSLNNLETGNFLYADREQLFGVAIVKKEFGESSESIIPRLMHAGNYFTQRAMTIPLITDPDSMTQRAFIMKSAREMYEQTIKIYENLYGKDSLKLVPPLRKLARAKLNASMGRKSAGNDINRAPEISSAKPEIDPAELHAVKIELADFYAITKDDRAAEQYIQTWEEMQQTEFTKKLAEKYFEETVRLYPPKIKHFSLDRRPDSAGDEEELYVDLEYDINNTGTVSRIRILHKNIPNDQARAVRQREKNTIYRPRISEGQLVAVEGNLLRQLFKVKKVDKTPQKPSEEKESEAD